MDSNQPMQPVSKQSTPKTLWALLGAVVLVAIGLSLYVYLKDSENGNVKANANVVQNANVNINVATNENGDGNTNATNVNETTNGNNNTPADSNANAGSNSNKPVDTSNWKTYKHTNPAFSLEYPSDWTFTVADADERTTGELISIQSPASAAALRNRTINSEYSNDVTVSFWQDINNEYARGGSWVGVREYSSLADYLTDADAPKSKIGEITIDGYPANEVSIGGAGLEYGVMIQHSGIYEISFPTSWDRSQLSSIQKTILASFQISN